MSSKRSDMQKPETPLEFADSVSDSSEDRIFHLFMDDLPAVAIAANQSDSLMTGKTRVSGLSRKGKKTDEVRKSFHNDEAAIYEQVHRNGENLFLRYDKKSESITYTPTADDIIPLEVWDNELTMVGLSDGAIDYGSEAELLGEINKFIEKYLDIDEDYRRFACYYILLSWVYDRFYSLPYLRAIGDFGVGKSRFLDVVGGICYRSMNLSGAVSSAAMFRIINKWGGTLIFDEADFQLSNEKAEIIKILNSGFEKNRSVARVNMGDLSKIDYYNVFCPKIIATRKRFDDKALESRCLTITMKPTIRMDIPSSLGEEYLREQNQLRAKLLMYRLKHLDRIDPEMSIKIELEGIEPRLRQISSPFGVLLMNNKELFDEFKVFIRKHQDELIEQRGDSLAGEVVYALFELFRSSGSQTRRIPGGGGTNVIPVTSRMVGTKVDQDSTSVGKILKELGLGTVRGSIGGEMQRWVIYDEHIFKLLEQRYLPPDWNTQHKG
jgi:hypothetical protein